MECIIHYCIAENCTDCRNRKYINGAKNIQQNSDAGSSQGSFLYNVAQRSFTLPDTHVSNQSKLATPSQSVNETDIQASDTNDVNATSEQVQRIVFLLIASFNRCVRGQHRLQERTTTDISMYAERKTQMIDNICFEENEMVR